MLLGLPGVEVTRKQLGFAFGVRPWPEGQANESNHHEKDSGNDQPVRQFQQWHGDTPLPLMNERPP
ncbi:hypothetical protein [Bradyrhizobium sp. ORS 86]|uniref:hypothetical protein n=1 Tax=Bradyrhizobium sp. ORS 86 TaxID=1685970 RepID=UPI00388D7024